MAENTAPGDATADVIADVTAGATTGEDDRINKDFATASHAFRAGTLSLDVLRAALDRTTIYTLRPKTARPGVLAVDVRDGGRWVVACTSLRGLTEFAAARGETAVEWLSTTGADLIQQLPPRVGLLLEPGTDHAVALPPVWLHPATDPTGRPGGAADGLCA
jgi:hypothetical protein